MNVKEYIQNNGRWLLVAALGVAVFCYFLFKLPFLMLAREQSQLFLWNTDYLVERLIIPGGLAQYLGEMIIQFYLNPLYGALWYGVLFVIVQMLTYGAFGKPQKWYFWLLSLVPSVVLVYLWTIIHFPMTLTVAIILAMALAYLVRVIRGKMQLTLLIFLMPVGYWLIGPAIILAIIPYLFNKKHIPFVAGLVVLLVGCVVLSARLAPYPLAQLARGVDYYWDDKKLGSYEEMAFDMRIRRNQASQQEMLNNFSPSTEALRSISTAFSVSDIAMQIGMVNIAQRAAFEAMEAAPNYNKSGRALRRLVETNLITGQTEVALKYIAILEQTTFYRGWAERMKQMAEQPELLNKHQYYHRLKEIYDNGKDLFFY